MSLPSEGWALKAEHDFKIGERELTFDDPVTDMVCFHMQQCVEKYLKAYLAFRGIPFRRTHDIAELIELCRKADPEFEALYELRADKLTRYAVEARYPEEFFVPDLEEAREAFRIAEAVRQWIKGKLPLPGGAS